MSYRTQKRSHCIKIAAFFAPVFLFFGCAAEPTLPVYDIKTEGQGTTLADQTITTAGGTVSGTDGFEIVVPEGAFDKDIKFTVVSKEIVSTNLPFGVTVGTPLYSIDDGGQTSGKFMKVHLPMSIAEDEIPLVVTWNQETGIIDVLGFSGYDENGVDAITRHFSPVSGIKLSVDMVRKANLDSIAFELKRDNWQFKNFTAHASPGGQCQGMTSSALWYWTLKAERATGVYGQDLYPDISTSGTLWNKYESFGVSDLKTPEFPLDDEMARKMVGTLQVEADLLMTTDYLDYFSSDDIFKMKGNSKLFYQISAALQVTKAPQYITLSDSTGFNRHSILCYAKSGDTLSCYDPNEGDDPKKLKYDFSKKDWISYNSSLTRISSIDKASTFTWNRIPELWKQMESGTVGSDYFPLIGYFISELDQNGNVNNSFEADLVSVNEVDSDKLSFFIIGPSNLDLVSTVYILNGDQVNKLDQETIDLSEKELTFIGILVREKLTDATESYWPWIDFKWFSVEYEKETGAGSCCFYKCGDGSTNEGYGYPTAQRSSCMSEAEEQCMATSETYPQFYGVVNCLDCSSSACFSKWEAMQ